MAVEMGKTLQKNLKRSQAGATLLKQTPWDKDPNPRPYKDTGGIHLHSRTGRTPRLLTISLWSILQAEGDG